MTITFALYLMDRTFIGNVELMFCPCTGDYVTDVTEEPGIVRVYRVVHAVHFANNLNVSRLYVALADEGRMYTE